MPFDHLSAKGHPRQDCYYWRVIATGFAFFAFGVSGILAGLVIVPLLRLSVRDRMHQQAIARRLLQRFFQAFIYMLVVFRVITWSINSRTGLERRATIVVANHPSLLDVVLLVALVPDACCIVKQSLFRNVVMRSALATTGYIGNGDPIRMLESAAVNLQRGSPLVLFPEGTRTDPGQTPVFGRSAANLSVRTGHSITPVFIRCQPTTLTRNERWYQVPYRRVQYTITAGPECPAVQADQPAAPVSILVRRQQARVMDFYQRMLVPGEPSP